MGLSVLFSLIWSYIHVYDTFNIEVSNTTSGSPNIGFPVTRLILSSGGSAMV